MPESELSLRSSIKAHEKDYEDDRTKCYKDEFIKSANVYDNDDEVDCNLQFL